MRLHFANSLWSGLLAFAISVPAMTGARAAACGVPAAGDPAPETLIKEGHWKQARAAVGPQYKANPNDAELAYLMSEIEDAFDNLEDARSLAEKAVALKPADARYHRQLADMDGETAEAVSLFSKSGWAKKFKAEAEKGAELDPQNIEVRFDLLEYDLQAPRLMGGGKDKAAAMAQEIARIDPVKGDLAEARLAQDQKNASAEESWYRKALTLRPDDYEVLTDLAGYYERLPQPRFDEARKYAEQAIRAAPGRVDAFALLAYADASEGKWSDLEAALAEGQKSVPDDLDPYYRAGLAILNRNQAAPADLKRAEEYFRKYLGAETEGNQPTPPDAHWRLGLVLEKEGRKADAVAELKTAVKLNPQLGGAKKDLERLEK